METIGKGFTLVLACLICAVAICSIVTSDRVPHLDPAKDMRQTVARAYDYKPCEGECDGVYLTMARNQAVR